MADSSLNGTTTAGTDRGQALAELNPKMARLGTWVFKIVMADVVEFQFPWKGSQILKTKLRVLLQTKDEGEYVMGLVKVNRDRAAELDSFKQKFTKGTMFRSVQIAFLNDEKSAYISAPRKMVIDLKRSKFAHLIQAVPNMPAKASPLAPIAELLDIKPSGNVHRFDVMGVAQMGPVRTANVKTVKTTIVDVKLVDGSKGKSGKVAEVSFSVFVPAGLSDALPDAMQQLVNAEGKVLSFFAMNASIKASTVEFSTSTEYYWEMSEGTKALQLQNMSAELQILAPADRETLNDTYTPSQARDFTQGNAALSGCALLDHMEGENKITAKDQLVQVNFAIIEPPEPGSSVQSKSGDRLWMKVKCQDFTGSTEQWLRERPALQLSGCATMEDFVQAHQDNNLSFPVLCSFRAHIQPSDSTKQSSDSQSHKSGDGGIVIVEATDQDLELKPNSSVEDLWQFVKQCAPRTDAIIPANLSQLRQSSHYAMQVDVSNVMRPCEKALVLVAATEKSKQSDIRDGVARIETPNVMDAMDALAAGSTEHQNRGTVSGHQKFTLVTMCPTNKTSEVAFMPPRTGEKSQVALCVVTQIMPKNFVVVQSVRLISHQEVNLVTKLMAKLQAAAWGVSYEGIDKRPHWGDPVTNPAHAAKKCRELGRYPTSKSLD